MHICHLETIGGIKVAQNIIEDFHFFGEILKKSGYKSLSYSMAEILDNAIDANASDIILLAESNGPNSNVTRLGFLDNGKGMNYEILSKCLKIGGREDTKAKGRTGKFGFGLPGASIANSDIVRVYSWIEEKPNEVYMVEMDVNHLNDGIADPVLTDIPTPYSDYICEDFGSKESDGNDLIGPINYKKSGTLVLWEGCERVLPKRPKNILNKQINRYISRLFRHFLTDDSFSRENFKKVNIYWIHDLVSGRKPTVKKIKPNDPLFLMSDSQLSSVDIPVLFDHKNTLTVDIAGHPVTVRFSLASKELRQSYSGKSSTNDEIGYNQGISIVREGRELDFGSFDFIDTDVRHRFHGCEIIFDSNLDDIFGVPANKQHVDRLKEYKAEDGEFADDMPDDELPVWLLLQRNFSITEQLNSFLKIIREYAKKPKPGLDNEDEDDVDDGSDVVVDTDDDENSTSQGTLSDEDTEAVNNCTKILNSLGYENPTKAQINRFLTHKVVWETVSRGESAGFMDVRVEYGYCILTLNKDSVFFQEVLTELYQIDSDNDTNISRGVELMLLAFAREMDLTRGLEGSVSKEFRRVLSKWSFKTEEYLHDYYNI